MAAKPVPGSGTAATFALKVLPLGTNGKFNVSHYPQGFARRACKRKFRVVGLRPGILRHALSAHLVDDGIHANFPAREHSGLVSPMWDSAQLELGSNDFESAFSMIVSGVAVNFHTK